MGDPFPDWISEFLNVFFIWMGHARLWLLICGGVLFVLYLIALKVYEKYEDEMGYRYYLAKYHSATPPEERRRNLEKVVNTTIASES